MVLLKPLSLLLVALICADVQGTRESALNDTIPRLDTTENYLVGRTGECVDSDQHLQRGLTVTLYGQNRHGLCRESCDVRGACTAYATQDSEPTCTLYYGAVVQGSGVYGYTCYIKIPTESATCVDIAPPRLWGNPTCELQLRNTNHCAERLAGTLQDYFCYSTCGVCSPRAANHRGGGVERLRELAAGKPASQSSEHFSGGDPWRGVDGNPSITYADSSCTHTGRDISPWWRVDLEKPFDIVQVEVWNRGDCCSDRINGAEIKLSNVDDVNSATTCATISSMDWSETFDCVGTARYLFIQIPEGNTFLTLCEVKVWGPEDQEEAPPASSNSSLIGSSESRNLTGFWNSSLIGLCEECVDDEMCEEGLVCHERKPFDTLPPRCALPPGTFDPRFSRSRKYCAPPALPDKDDEGQCTPVSTSTADAGYVDDYRGWYSLSGDGCCNDYCRWVGDSGAGGDPAERVVFGSSRWDCRLAGGTAPYSGSGYFTSFSYSKCAARGIPDNGCFPGCATCDGPDEYDCISCLDGSPITGDDDNDGAGRCTIGGTTESYSHTTPGCVNGQNIVKYADKTVEECAALCDEYGSGCKGFEYGVAHGGGGTSYNPGDCQLSSSAATAGCDGSNWNLDFYTKVGAGGPAHGLRYVYLGCYQDDNDGDLRHGPRAAGYTARSCMEACADHTAFFALQDRSHDEGSGWCSCDDEYSTPPSAYPALDEAECGADRAGGLHANAVYRIIRGDTRELARHQPTAQSSTKGVSSTLPSIPGSAHGRAHRAVDGGRSTQWEDDSCTHTNEEDPAAMSNPWWRVDLGATFRVSSVRVWNREDCCGERINGARIMLSAADDVGEAEVCATIEEIAGADAEFDCVGAGRYVFIQIPGDDKILTLCEVQVYGTDYAGLERDTWPQYSGRCVDKAGSEAGRGDPIPDQTDAGCKDLCDSDQACTAYTFLLASSQCIKYSGNIVRGDGSAGSHCSIRDDHPAPLQELAWSRAARQSSTDAGGGAAGRAVDGRTAANWRSHSCTRTAPQDDPWWRVDLEAPRHVGDVQIWTLREAVEQLEGANILVSDVDDVNSASTCHTITGLRSSQDTFTCAMDGRYLFIQLPGRNRTLALCEVQVWGQPEPACMGAGMDVAWGFDHIAEAYPGGVDEGIPGVASDIRCAERCSAAEECTVWVREPATNACWLSRQPTAVFQESEYRSAGRRCAYRPGGHSPGTWTLSLMGEYVHSWAETVLEGDSTDRFRVASVEDKSCRVHGSGRQLWLQRATAGGSNWEFVKMLSCHNQEVMIDEEVFEPRARAVALPAGSNRAPPEGFVAKPGSGPCECRDDGFGLHSCGELCCEASPFTDPDPRGHYYFEKGGRTRADMCYEKIGPYFDAGRWHGSGGGRGGRCGERGGLDIAAEEECRAAAAALALPFKKAGYYDSDYPGCFYGTEEGGRLLVWFNLAAEPAAQWDPEHAGTLCRREYVPLPYSAGVTCRSLFGDWSTHRLFRATLGECAEACAGDEACRYFTFDGEDGGTGECTGCLGPPTIPAIDNDALRTFEMRSTAHMFLMLYGNQMPSGTDTVGVEGPADGCFLPHRGDTAAQEHYCEAQCAANHLCNGFYVYQSGRCCLYRGWPNDLATTGAPTGVFYKRTSYLTGQDWLNQREQEQAASAPAAPAGPSEEGLECRYVEESCNVTGVIRGNCGADLGTYYFREAACQDPAAAVQEEGRCWQSTLERAQAICARQAECRYVSEGPEGFEPRGAGLPSHDAAARTLWMKACHDPALEAEAYVPLPYSRGTTCADEDAVFQASGAGTVEECARRCGEEEAAGCRYFTVLEEGFGWCVGCAVPPTAHSHGAASFEMRRAADQFTLLYQGKHPLHTVDSGLQGPDQRCFNDNVDDPADSIAQCEALCASNRECNGFWVYDIGRCCLKRGWPDDKATRDIPRGSFFKRNSYFAQQSPHRENDYVKLGADEEKPPGPWTLSFIIRLDPSDADGTLGKMGQFGRKTSVAGSNVAISNHAGQTYVVDICDGARMDRPAIAKWCVDHEAARGRYAAVYDNVWHAEQEVAEEEREAGRISSPPPRAEQADDGNVQTSKPTEQGQSPTPSGHHLHNTRGRSKSKVPKWVLIVVPIVAGSMLMLGVVVIYRRRLSKLPNHITLEDDSDAQLPSVEMGNTI